MQDGSAGLLEFRDSDVMLVDLSDLVVDYSPRYLKIDQEHVSALMEVIDRLPPVLIDQRRMTVIDGIHRLEAFRRAGRTVIPAVFFAGDDFGAMELAVRANVSHGKPLSSPERQAAALMLLEQCPDRSDRWLGEVCGLSHATVARMRKQSGLPQVTVRVGRDGKRRPVDPSLGRDGVERAIREDPSVSIRQAAQAAGVSPSTAQRLAKRGRRPRPPSGSARPVAWSGLHLAESGVDTDSDPAFEATPELAEVAAWLARTSVSPNDLQDHLESVPLGRMYAVADECRRRSRIWGEMAAGLETLVRTHRTHTQSG